MHFIFRRLHSQQLLVPFRTFLRFAPDPPSMPARVRQSELCRIPVGHGRITDERMTYEHGGLSAANGIWELLREAYYNYGYAAT